MPPTLVLSSFISGIFRTDFLRDAFEAIPNQFVNEQQVISQLALAGKLFYVDQVLFSKEEVTSFCSVDIANEQLAGMLDEYNLGEHKRRQNRRRGKYRGYNTAFGYAWQTLRAHLRSTKIPLMRKWHSVFLILVYLLKKPVNKILKLFYKRPLNRQYNLLHKAVGKSKDNQK